MIRGEFHWVTCLDKELQPTMREGNERETRGRITGKEGKDGRKQYNSILIKNIIINSEHF